MAVFVLDRNQKPLMPCSEKRARLLLERKKAIIHRIEPFTIRLKNRRREESVLQEQRIKLDPGSKLTGFALVNESCSKVVLLGELKHKQGIRDSLESRSSLRRGRRNRNARYREARFNNRKRIEGWIAPSLQARVNQTSNLYLKLASLTPIISCSIEHVKFDMQKMQNPEISGVQYQQGVLQGYEVREYLLEKFGRRCAYCEMENVPLEVEHYIPKSRGGSDRVSNLTLACVPCNKDKDNLLPEEWIEKLKKSKKVINVTRLKNFIKVKEQLKKPLKEAAVVNVTRWALVNRFKSFGLSVELGSGALTKMNRIQRNLRKEHYFDALCVGLFTPVSFNSIPSYAMYNSYTGRGNRQMARVNKYGFPIGHRERKKTCHGFQTGDIVVANVTKGKKIGSYKGRVAIRHSGFFNIKEKEIVIQGIKHSDCRIIQRNDGWMYEKTKI